MSNMENVFRNMLPTKENFLIFFANLIIIVCILVLLYGVAIKKQSISSVLKRIAIYMALGLVTSAIGALLANSFDFNTVFYKKMTVAELFILIGIFVLFVRKENKACHGNICKTGENLEEDETRSMVVWGNKVDEKWVKATFSEKLNILKSKEVAELSGEEKEKFLENCLITDYASVNADGEICFFDMEGFKNRQLSSDLYCAINWRELQDFGVSSIRELAVVDEAREEGIVLYLDDGSQMLLVIKSPEECNLSSSILKKYF